MVSRDDWCRTSVEGQWTLRPVERAYTADDARLPHRNLTIPNVSCPECGDPVFFFMDVHGGRVFFDPPLGKPWPKHPCTSNLDATSPRFGDLGEIDEWLAARRAQHGPGVRDEDLALAPGQTSSRARIIRRRGNTIALVHTNDGARAFLVEGAWPGRKSLRIYHEDVAAPGRPESLDYLGEDLTPRSIPIVGETELPQVMTSGDVAAVAEGAIPEIEAWAKRHLPNFRLGPRVKLEGHVVALAGRLGQSRIVLAPLAAWFDQPGADTGREPENRSTMSIDQVRTWTSRIAKALDRSPSTKAHPLYRDVFVWLVAPHAITFAVRLAVETTSEIGERRLSPKEIAATSRLHGRHVVQELDDPAENAIRETRHSFDELVAGEHAYLIQSWTTSSEKRWLNATLKAAGLDGAMAKLEQDGVRFTFHGTGGDDPRDWGQQVSLPDGRRLLVLLHLSSAERGLALVSFGQPTSDDGLHDSIPLEAMFHARRLADIVAQIGTGQ